MQTIFNVVCCCSLFLYLIWLASITWQIHLQKRIGHRLSDINNTRYQRQDDQVSYVLLESSLVLIVTHDSPENRSQSSPLMFSGMPCSTSSLVLSVRYMHTPWPYSVKWFLQACSFRNSLAWNMSIKRATHLLPWLQLHKCWWRRISAGTEAKPVNRELH